MVLFSQRIQYSYHTYNYTITNNVFVFGYVWICSALSNAFSMYYKWQKLTFDDFNISIYKGIGTVIMKCKKQQEIAF